MKTRLWPLFIACFCLGLQVKNTAGAPGGAANSRAPLGPPNILYIMSDQQRFDALGAVNPAVRTPALDRLSKEGVRFAQYYVAQAVCTPSRATIFSGLYPHTHKLQANVYGVDNALADPRYHLQVVWPELLRQAGYYAGYIGKWHLGEKAPACFDEYRGYNSLQPHWLGKRQKSQYRSDMETDQAIEFLERNQSKQFALCVSFYPPHTQYDPPQKFADIYEKSGLEPAGYWGAVTAIDACVGRILEKLDALGLRERTLVIFTSDHGDHFGKRSGGSYNKEVPYEETARVPLILRLPGAFEGGRVIQELVCNVDLMPTILETAGLGIPRNLQGASLVPLGRGEAKNWRTLVCTENNPGGKLQEQSRGIRTGHYKLILRQRLAEGVPGLYELYDLEKDPREQSNLFGKDQAGVVRRILTQFDAWAKKTGDAFGLELAENCRKSLAER